MATTSFGNSRPKVERLQRLQAKIQVDLDDPWVAENKLVTGPISVDELGPILRAAFEPYVDESKGDIDIHVGPFNASVYMTTYSKLLEDVLLHRSLLESGKTVTYLYLIPREEHKARNESRITAFIGPYDDDEGYHGGGYSSDHDDEGYHGGGYSSDHDDEGHYGGGLHRHDEGENRCPCGFDGCEGDCGTLDCGCIDVCRCDCYREW